MSYPVNDQLGMRALIVNDELKDETAAGRASRAIVADLIRREVDVVEAISAEDGLAVVCSDTSIQCVILDWNLESDPTHVQSIKVLDELRARNAAMPVFLLADRGSVTDIPAEVMQKVGHFIWLLEDTPDFIGGRIVAAINRYREQILPPMFAALVRFSRIYEYSWHTPGHTGGTAFLKHPAGRAFFEFFGEELFRSDLSISVNEMGSLLDHSGPIGDSERYAARVFGAHRTYYVTNGSSTSNRIILMASVTRDQITLCDRNCHKSVEHAMTLSGAIPTYLIPSRNRLGLIGPILPSNLTVQAIQKSIQANPLVHKGIDPQPIHAIITNSTYDGLCYNVTRVEELLGKSVDRLHFDEAWYGYARFNPIYQDRHAMHGEAKAHDSDKPTVFATQSTHKLLAALSQASYIHVRDGKNPIEHDRFNEAFMMHASTSPQYAIIASNDVSAAMMDGPSGEALTTESIQEAVAFRQTLSRLHTEYAQQGEWFFQGWQPETVKIPSRKKAVPFHLAPAEFLVKQPDAWVLRPNETWHGFGAIEDNYCMLDPIKVSIVTPGIKTSGGLAKMGIPAAVLTAYLDQLGVVAEKTTDFTALFLFSLGITKGKWGTLVNALLRFKQDYDANTPLIHVLTVLAKHYPASYGEMGLQDLCTLLFNAMGKARTTEYLSHAFSILPEPDLSPVEAYEQLVKNNVETLPLDQAAGRTVATAVVPYPPGIPLLMPGENVGATDGPVLNYLRSLETMDSFLPGFSHDTHGVEIIEGKYHILCIKTKKG